MKIEGEIDECPKLHTKCENQPLFSPPFPVTGAMSSTIEMSKPHSSLQICIDNTPPPSLPSTQKIETPAAESNPQPPSRPCVAGDQNLEWANTIFAFCFASAIGIAIMSVQTHLQLPPTFYVLSLVISLAFTSQFVAIFIRSELAAAACVLDQTGVFFAATAFFLAITLPLPTSLVCATWTLYAIALLAQLNVRQLSDEPSLLGAGTVALIAVSSHAGALAAEDCNDSMKDCGSQQSSTM